MTDNSFFKNQFELENQTGSIGNFLLRWKSEN